LIFELDLNPNINTVLCVSFVNGNEHASMAMNMRVVFNKFTRIPSDFSQT
jgi:hypothetical protein